MNRWFDRNTPKSHLGSAHPHNSPDTWRFCPSSHVRAYVGADLSPYEAAASATSRPAACTKVMLPLLPKSCGSG